MKKISALLLCLVLCLGMAGCNAFHDHTWSYNAQSHWCDCECGKQIEPLPHNLSENVCAACGVKILDFGDTRYIETYDEHGSVKAWSEYDSYGNILQDAHYEWEYDHDGNPMRSVKYLDGALSEEVTYQPSLRDDLEVCEKERVEYFEEGCRKVWTYDEYGYPLSGTVYLADGSVSTQDTFENTYDDQGNISYRSRSTDGVIVSESFYKPDPDGGVYVAHEIYYRKDGTKSYEYIIDDETGQREHIEYNADGSIKE